MDNPIISLPPDVSAVLNINFTIVQVVSMFAIGAWNSLEVVIGIFERFKRYRGLYFWSMQIAAWGILLHALPAQTVYTGVVSPIIMSAPFLVGWICMVTGQAVVLYSRLHLVVADIRHVQWVLWMIIANFFVLHVPMSILYCLNLRHNLPFDHSATIYDRIQVVVFAIQDTVICAIYAREALRALKPVFEAKGRQGRGIIYRIVFANIFGIVLNALILAAEFKLHYIAISFKTVVYSIKLKLEFHALMQLRELTRTYPCALCQGVHGSPRGSSEINIFDMFVRNPRSQDTEMQTVSGIAGTPSTADTAHGGTYHFHEAMRQRISTVNSDESQASARPRIHSSDTHSTVEMTLIERPK
ncbi:hypothetical protein N7517_002084 [Penicillium concentricum]|uniref:DUF7703 domain-containing protein n=1 Tax=Penicillium concentricum TaxID=293559 RepID=A0A9W9VJ64_9EURO|nr:uncharacterized protein N7517_002084 [Penicillium concentricum]KAJ5384173.1 hypothetical protein N7517_002084 [Penicillium concentricum]